MASMSLIAFEKTTDTVPMLVEVAKLGFPREINDAIFNIAVAVEQNEPRLYDRSAAENARVVAETCRLSLMWEKMTNEKREKIKKMLQSSYTEIERANW